MAGAIAGPVVSVVALVAIALARAYRTAPSGFQGGGGNPYGLGFPSWGALGSVGIAIAIPLVVGGVAGVMLARSWWGMVAVDAAGLALMVSVLSLSAFVPWLCLVLGVSSGAGVRRLRQRRSVARASFLGRPT
jgi:hypothetical protein